MVSALRTGFQALIRPVGLQQTAPLRAGDVKAATGPSSTTSTPTPATLPSPRRRDGPKALAAKWRKLYPAAVDCLEDDFEHLVTFLRFPAEHWGRIRHSNFIERTFGETRRRVKVIGRLPGERSCLSLVWAVLDRASRGWRGVQQTIPSIRRLAELRADLLGPHDTTHEQTSDLPENVPAVA